MNEFHEPMRGFSSFDEFREFTITHIYWYGSLFHATIMCQVNNTATLGLVLMEFGILHVLA